jgi:predicted MFS family arabinose efflux permease
MLVALSITGAVCLVMVLFMASITGRAVGSLADAEVEATAESVALAVQAELSRVASLHIPLTQVPDIDDFLVSEVARHKSLAFGSIYMMDGTHIATATGTGLTGDEAVLQVEHKLQQGYDDDRIIRRRVLLWDDHQRAIAVVVVGYYSLANISERRLLLLDALASALIALLLLHELLQWRRARGRSFFNILGGATTWSGASVTAPARTVVFLLFATDSILRPLLPSLAGLVAKDPGAPPSVLAAASVMVAFELAFMLSQLLRHHLVKFATDQRLMLFGALATFIGVAMLLFAPTLLVAIVGRLVAGFGTGLVTICAQLYVCNDRNATEHNPTQLGAITAIAFAIISAVIVGPFIGGLIADAVSLKAAIIVAAACAFAATLLCLQFSVRTPRAPPEPFDLHRFWALLRSHKLVTYILVVGLPTKVSATAVLLYYIPFHGVLIESGALAVGRLLLLYGVGVLFGLKILLPALYVVLPRNWIVVIALLLSAVALGGPQLFPAGATSGIGWESVLFFGLMHGLLMLPALDGYCRVAGFSVRGAANTGALALYRLGERVGATAGPIVAAVIALSLGDKWLLPAMAAMLTLSALGAYLIMIRQRPL